ncbi:MAG: tRNA dihydrouridine(20/20a) synthase DusA [Steroidobacteraceae bacterium]
MENATKTVISVEKRSGFIDRRVSVAPMMDWTDRHCRYFLRSFSPSMLLYTEMITSAAILHGDRARLLRFSTAEHPVALQLGGSSPADLAIAARAGAEAGYDEINLNCGCPSDRVSAGAFGACLMRRPKLVADCVAAMRAVVRVPVTVKMRIGVVVGRGIDADSDVRSAMQRFDERDYELLHDFTATLIDAGADALIVHARKAVLGGLSPKDNREVPPLRFEVVRRLRADFPERPIILNGGVRDAAMARDALAWCDGVMLGREAYHRPYVLAELHAGLLQDPAYHAPSPIEVIERMVAYASLEIARGERLSAITRHMLGLLAHAPRARDFRRLLSEGARLPGANVGLLQQAMDLLSGECGVRAPVIALHTR